MNIIKVYFVFGNTDEGLRDPGTWQCLKASTLLAEKSASAKISEEIHPFSNED